MATNAVSRLSSLQEPRSIERLPDEILFSVFALVANHHFDPSRQEPSIVVGDCSTWSKDLRFKKALLRVCKRWRIIATPFLYDRVFVHRIGQLVGLVKVLEGCGYAPLVHHVHGRLVVFPHYEELYYKYIIRMLELCGSTRTFSWVAAWGHPNTEPLSARCLTVNLMLHASPSIHSTLKSLRKLTFSLDQPLQKGQASDSGSDLKLTFENLEELTCEASHFEHIEGLSFVSSAFVISRIKKIAINVPPYSPETLTLRVADRQFIYGLLESHGAKLSSLTLDFTWMWRITPSCVSSILNLTPNLQELQISTFAFVAFDSSNVSAGPFPNLEKIRLAISAASVRNGDLWLGSDDGLQGYFRMVESGNILPSLRTIALLSRYFPCDPMDGRLSPSIHEEAYTCLSTWAEKLHNRGISIVDVDDEILVPTGPERWTGRFLEPPDWESDDEDIYTDPEDLTYLPEDDEAYHADITSDYSSWDSEPEDGVSESESGPGGLVVYHNIGSDDAMEALHNDVDSSEGEAEDEMGAD
ncbi:hypothetical protein SCHPADRAFT_624509 [Schizopora paradoxa]|uniref:Uncharacterized protein n=1 Tax=Schizopora paradoxa TaxID=27342 RepID=A0A0H2R877_9AGAM|nr:hypothetical protein SCHPADRAFT_624509 [Schizopora paradoxa]